MKFLRVLLVLVAFLLTVGSSWAAPQEPVRERPQPERVQRWRKMENPRRQDMRRRWDRLCEMDGAKRAERLDRAQRLREIMAEVYRGMDAPSRARIDALEPAERARVLGQLALAEARSRSRE